MKQLIQDGAATDIFFTKESTLDTVCKWILNKGLNSELNPFDLNEPHSCDVFQNKQGGCHNQWR